ncbi:MAG: hypothetical protein RLZZ453_774 [Chlamydiota bacterium]|jgi:hypothetical protein
MIFFYFALLFTSALFGSSYLPLDDSVKATHLDSGVKLYVKEHHVPSEWASVRVIFHYGKGEHSLFAFDKEEQDWEGLDEFLTACAVEASDGNYTPIKEQYPTNFSSLLSNTTPKEISVIAVGSFSCSELESRVATCFEGVSSCHRHPELISFSSELHPMQVAISLNFPYVHSPIKTEQDLTDCSKKLLLHELLQQRLESCTKKIHQVWIHPHPQGFYPPNGFALVKEDEAKNLLAFFLWHIEVLKERGFYDACFTAKKNQLLYRLSYLLACKDTLSCAQLSSYYADLVQLGANCYALEPFLTSAFNALEQVEFDDLLPYLDSFLAKERRHIHIIYSNTSRLPIMNAQDIHAIEQEIEELAGYYLNDEEEAEEPFEAALRKVNARMEPKFMLAGNNSFYDLPLSQDEKKTITAIITTMAENNIFQLAFHKSSLEKKGKKIDHVHPLRFMGHILSNHTLKNHIRTIKKSSFKWDALIDGFSKKMREQVSKNNVYQHLPGFAEAVGTTPDKLTPYIQRGDFEGIVKSLL